MISWPKEKRKIKGADWFLIIALSLLLLICIVYFSSQSFADWLTGFGPQIEDFALRHGYFGAFLIVLISNVSLIIIIPYASILFLLGSLGLNPWLLSIITAVAAAMGEVVAYVIGRSARGFVKNEEYIKKFERIKLFISKKPKLVPLLIFIFGATPIPDDIIMIPLGLVKYNFWKAIIPDALGKLVMIMVVVFSGKYTYSVVSRSLGSEGGFLSGVIVVFLTIILIYFTIKIKWDKIIKI